MLKVGITGGIGSGKTTICKIFEVLGVPVFYADTAAKEVMISDPLLIKELKDAFGQSVYSSEGELNRKYLANIVFNNEEQLGILNSLVHPAVFRAFDAWAITHSSAPYLLKEAALLFESGSYKQNDYSILVTSPLELRIQRVMLRDSIPREQVMSRMDKQLSDDEKMKMADYILHNDESQLLTPQVLELHKTFLNIANKQND